MNINEILQFLALSISLIAAILHVAEVKHELEKEIDIITLKSQERKELVDYRLNALNEKIDHIHSRLIDTINDLNKENE